MRQKKSGAPYFSRKTPLFLGLANLYREGWIEGLEQYTLYAKSRIITGFYSDFWYNLVHGTSFIQFIIKPHQQDHADSEERNKPPHTSLTFMVYVRHIQPTPLLSLPHSPLS